MNFDEAIQWAVDNNVKMVIERIRENCNICVFYSGDTCCPIATSALEYAHPFVENIFIPVIKALKKGIER